MLKSAGWICLRSATLVLAATAMAACHVWKPHTLSPPHFSEANHPTQARFTLFSGAVVQLTNPVIRGDSIVGSSPVRIQAARRPSSSFSLGTAPANGAPGAVALTDVRWVEIRKLSGAKTLGMIAGIGITAILIDKVLDGGNSPAPVPPGPPPPPPPPTSPPTPPRPPAPCTYCGGMGSCPLVYSWNGSEWILDSGTFGGAILEALARTDVDNLRFAKAELGIVRLKVANELPETDYLDAIALLAVDHDPDVRVAPSSNGEIHTFGAAFAPLRARDYDGRDVLNRLSAEDGLQWESSLRLRDTSSAEEVRDGVELTFPRPAGARTARIVIDGHNTPWAAYLLTQFIAAHGRETRAWKDSMRASPENARLLGELLAHEGFLSVKVFDGSSWKTAALVWEAGPEIIKRQIASLDLSAVSGDSVRIRLESVPSFWILDQVQLDYTPPREVVTTVIAAASATDHAGHDVAMKIAAVDGNYYVIQRGEYAELAFKVPPVPAGKTRSYLLRSHGWYDLHTAMHGEPLEDLLSRIGRFEMAISRIAVGRLNDALTSAGEPRK